MRFLLGLFQFSAVTYSYSFCPKCIHYTKTDAAVTPTCNLFRTHPLFKDRPDVDFLGKEICGEKGKYFFQEGVDENRKDESIFKGRPKN
jgi:hypothetical protein